MRGVATGEEVERTSLSRYATSLSIGIDLLAAVACLCVRLSCEPDTNPLFQSYAVLISREMLLSSNFGKFSMD
jgi:hypothetical protein